MTELLITRAGDGWQVVASEDGRPPYTAHGPVFPTTKAAAAFYGELAFRFSGPASPSSEAGPEGRTPSPDAHPSGNSRPLR